MIASEVIGRKIVGVKQKRLGPKTALWSILLDNGKRILFNVVDSSDDPDEYFVEARVSRSKG